MISREDFRQTIAPKLFVIFGLLSLYFVFRHWQILNHVKASMAAGEHEVYHNEFKALIIAQYDGMITALLLPFPFLIGWLQDRSRAWMYVAIAVFVAIMALSLYLGAMQTEMLHS